MRIWILLLAAASLLAAEEAAGVKWTGPQGWKNEGSRPMRAATYSVRVAQGDSGPAECVVYFFGAGSGGTVEANLDRWKSQFLINGQPAPAKVEKRTIHGLTVTAISSAGDYTGMSGPNAAPSNAHNFRLLGAIVEGPGGNLFVKFAAPARTVAANEKQFEALLSSFTK
jgi:hypothetical protein